MMRLTETVGLVLAGLALAGGGMLLAQGGRKIEDGMAQQVKRSAKPVGEDFRDKLKLTNEQTPRVDQIWRTFSQALANWKRENGDQGRLLQEDLAAAIKAGDQEKAASIREKLADIYVSRKQLHENLIRQLSEVLTPEQLDQVRWHYGLLSAKGKGLELLERVNLSELQRQKVEKIEQDASEEILKARSLAGEQEVLRKVRRRVIDEVLTREQLEHLRKRGLPRRAASGPASQPANG